MKQRDIDYDAFERAALSMVILTHVTNNTTDKKLMNKCEYFIDKFNAICGGTTEGENEVWRSAIEHAVKMLQGPLNMLVPNTQKKINFMFSSKPVRLTFLSEDDMEMWIR